MALKAGTVSDFNGSMAEAIENAMREAWPEVMGPGQSFQSNPQLKLLCVAVAQGVVAYLHDHPSSFKVTVDISGGSDDDRYGEVTEIKTSGPIYG